MTSEQYLQSMFFNMARDDLMLKSVGDFIEKKSNIGYEFLDEIKRATSGELVTDTVTEGTILVTDALGQMRTASAQNVLNACYLGEDSFICDDGAEVLVDDYLTELGNSSSGLTAISEVLKQNYQDTVINGNNGTSVSDIVARLQTKFNNISDSAANVAYNTVDIVGNVSLSAKERVVRILNYLQGNGNEWSGIGAPSSDFKDVANGSAVVVWGLDVIKGASSVAEMVARTFTATFKVIGKFFSNLWDSLTSKVQDSWDVLVGKRDAFKTDLNIKNNHFNDIGVSFKLDNSDINSSSAWIQKGSYNYHTGYAQLLAEPSLLGRLNIFCEITSGVSHTYTEIQEAGYDTYRALGGTVDLSNSPILTIIRGCYYAALISRNYNTDDFINILNSISDINSLIIEAYKAAYMINYSAYVYYNNLDYDKYLHMNLPAGELYLWRDKDSNVIYGKMFTSPISPDWNSFISIVNRDSFNNSEDLINWFSNQYFRSIDTELGNITDAEVLDFIGFSMFINFMYLYMINNWFSIAIGDPITLMRDIAGKFNTWAGLFDGSGTSPYDCISVVADNDNPTLVSAITIGGDYNDDHTAIGFAKRLATTSDGSIIPTSNLTPVANIFGYIFEDDYYLAYERVNQVFPGKYSLYTTAELINFVNNGIGIVGMAVVVVAATVFAIKLKKAIYSAQGRADNTLYSAMDEETGVIDEDKIIQGFKLQKRANRLMLISSVTIGAVKSLVSNIGSAVVSFGRSIFTGVSSKVKGSTDASLSITNDAIETNAADVIEVITGRRPS